MGWLDASELTGEISILVDGTEVSDGRIPPAMGLVRGTTRSVLLVRRQVELESGDWPGPGEIVIGRLVATKLGIEPHELDVGTTLQFEGRNWQISGIFSAGGSVFESEIWCRLDELQQATQRQDLSIVAVTMAATGDFADIDAFCKERLLLFPEMDPTVDVPEISESCWTTLNLDPASLMCSSSRMVVKHKGARHPEVVACTLLPYDEEFSLGRTLSDSLVPISLNHPSCAQFCVLGGGSCTA